MADNYVMQNSLPAAPTAAPPPVETPDTIPMLNHDTKNIEAVPRDKMELALRSRKYALPRGVEVPILNPETLEVRLFKDHEVYEALDGGWKLENPEDTHKRVVEEKYGDRGGEALLQGVLRGGTLGISDQIQTRTGFRSPEDLSGMDEASPVLSGTGEAAGFVGSLFIPGVGPAKGAQLAGKATAKLITKEAIAVGASKSVAKSILEKTAPRFAGEAVEASFYSTGQLLSEDALGRSDFNAENFMSAVGVGTLVGGTFGVAGAGLEALMPLTKKAAGKIAKPVGDVVEGLTNETKAVTELFNLTRKESLKVEQNGLAPELAPYVREKLGLKRMSSDEEMLAALKLRGEASGNAIGEISEVLEKVGADKILAPEAARVFDRIEKEIKENFIDKLEDTVAGQTAVKQVKKILSGYETKYAGQDFLTAKQMLSEMRAIDDRLASFYKSTEVSKDAIKSQFAIRTVIRDEINELAERVAQVPGIDSSLAKQLKAANREFQIVKTLQPALERKILAKSGISLTDTVLTGLGVSNGVTGTVMAAAGKFVNSDLRRRLVILSKIEKANLDMFKTINTATKKFFEISAPVAGSTAMYKLSSSKLSYDLESGKKPKDEREAWHNIQNNVQRFSANPEQLIERTNRHSSAMYEVAPQTSAALDMSAHNAIQMLAAKMPKSAQNPGVMDLLGKKKMPSQYEISKFQRYLKAVESPKSIIKDLERGHIDHESVEVLKNVYPNVYENLRNNIIEKMSEKPESVSYNKKVRLGLLLDVATDSSMLPDSILGLQSMFTKQQEQPMKMNGADSLNIAGRTEMPLQKVKAGKES